MVYRFEAIAPAWRAQDELAAPTHDAPSSPLQGEEPPAAPASPRTNAVGTPYWFNVRGCIGRVQVLTSVFALFGLTAQSFAFDHAAVARRALENHIRPGYVHLAEAATALEHDTEALCEAPSAATLERVRASFRETVLAWGRIEHIRFGPIAEGNRHDWMIFWPDKRGIGRRHVEARLSGAASPGMTAGGLTAFDLVVFGPTSETLATESASPRCPYARDIAVAIAAVGREVSAAWADPSGYAALWLAPGPGNRTYLDQSETTRALVRVFLDGLEQTRDSRLAGPLGVRDPKLKPLTPPFPYSHLGAPRIAANIEGARALLAECGFLDPNLVGAEPAKTLAAVAEQLDRAAVATKAAAALTPEPFTDAQAKRMLVGIGFPLRAARMNGGAALSEAAGLGIGLNASDGD